MANLNRRAFLAGLAAVPMAADAVGAAQNTATTDEGRVPAPLEKATPSPYVRPAAPIIDTHIHLFDKTRLQGGAYPGDMQPGLTMLPPRYRATVRSTGIVGAIVTECSSLPEDTLWVLDLCKSDPLLLSSTVGSEAWNSRDLKSRPH